MKKFIGARKAEEQEKMINKKGWETYERNHQQRMVKKFEGIGIIDVCLRSFGKFIAYDENGISIGSERSEELDGTIWYDEILDILYISEKE